MTTWEEPQLFDIPPDRRIRSRGRAIVRLEVVVDVEVDLDRLDRIEGLAREIAPRFSDAWASDPKEVEWAIGNAAWCSLAEDLGVGVDAEIRDVLSVRLPVAFTSFAHLVEEIAHPVWEPIDGGAA